MRAESSRRPEVATSASLRCPPTSLSSARGRGARRTGSKIAFGPVGSGAPFQSGWVVSWPAATEPSLAVKSIVVVKVALPFVSF